ncbi:hypothetical protein CP10139811_1547 [Chlamydia ibidis]|uniref:Uncharacterized protein n=1 Tax=Chlamydia ibidis TaxID=1405396 RepID=S7KM10_9CHLA|nr:hypothetical protein [Chlamydia ibidis]EPP35485.1 hypothetical protein CP10139811_1547 [Chlamydia ibidis]
MNRPTSKEKALPMSMHALKNILGNENHEKLLKEGKVVPQEGITHLGIDLSDMELRIVEGILKAFAETQNRGNAAPIPREELERGYGDIGLPKTFDNIQNLPRIHLTQKKLFNLAGIKENSIADKERAVNALFDISQKKYQIYYSRLAHNENGEPSKNRFGRWEKEFVTGVGTLFNIYQVFSEESKQLRYYEIYPNPAFLDQIESYFVLIPYEWRKEVKKVAGGKRISFSTYLFLLYLRYQYEVRRRSKKASLPNELSEHWEKIAQAIRISPSNMKEHKKRVHKTLITAYDMAKTLGYIVDYECAGDVHVLTFNTEKYLPSSGEQISRTNQSAETKTTRDEKSEMFEFFYKEKRAVDPNCEIPEDRKRVAQINSIGNILKKRPKQEFCDVVSWGLRHKFWCSKISSPNRLRYHFDDIFAEMQNSVPGYDRIGKRKRIAERLHKIMKNKNPQRTFEILSSVVEIGDGLYSDVIHYSEDRFKSKLIATLEKWGFESVDIVDLKK